jgi:hypothetical protein
MVQHALSPEEQMRDMSFSTTLTIGDQVMITHQFEHGELIGREMTEEGERLQMLFGLGLI